ncbi:MAG: hypothetical protein EBR90_02040 [Actinobacteria bacterium]|nr:hypothetical protein [Actinomycetota bacterium]
MSDKKVSDVKHTQEPWLVNRDGEITDADGNNIISAGYHFDYQFDNINDASRIVACVNACKNVDNETLEKIANGEMNGSEILELAQVKKQRAQLLEALKEVRADASFHLRKYRPHVLELVESAIAAVEQSK